ncbi:MAG: aldo/keto reductase [Propionibacteriaceae bacterium]|jgi:aryl-alcohol dehydrogenase-like predicted oxidoreductase|nr:aldo/keto reductase [Propionibacteriaceae bacterium]
MEQRALGDTGITVSRLGLGTLTWGRDVDPPQARKLMRAFVAAGGNLIDTAPAYGAGLAERIIGSLMRHDVPREQLVIATKAGFGGPDGGQRVDVSRQALLADLEGSLQRLGTDYVDIWQLHAWGEGLSEALGALDYAVARGMARAVGVCNYVGWQLGSAATIQLLGDVGTTRLSVASSEYSLLARGAETEVLPACRYHGLGFFAWAPLGRGVLPGRYLGGVTPTDSRAASPGFEWYVEPYLNAKSMAVVDALAHAAEGLGMTPPQVPLLWVRDAPGVTAVLLGARSAEQLQPYLDAESKTLPNEIVSALDDITGGANLLR